MANIVEIKTERNVCASDVKEILLESAEKDLECVVVIGVYRDGRVLIERSRAMDTLRFLGAVESAKDSILKAWK